MGSTILRTKNFNLFHNLFVFYIHLFYVKVTEDYMKKNKICRSISGYVCVKV